jgi:hypothetical protein
MNNKKEIIIACLVVTFSILFRLINTTNSIFNFTPILALSLFSGSIFTNKKMSYALPLIAMLLSDIFLQLFTKIQGFYGVSQFFNYAILALVVALGTTLKNKTILNIAGYTIASSLLFFILSNFGVWFFDSYNMYPKTITGLAQCMSAGIAFYKQQIQSSMLSNPIAGDLYFSALFFGGYALYKQIAFKNAIA